jgi:hypothetical protein
MVTVVTDQLRPVATVKWICMATVPICNSIDSTSTLRVSGTKMINKQAIELKWNRKTQRYTFGHKKCVHDLSLGTHVGERCTT